MNRYTAAILIANSPAYEGGYRFAPAALHSLVANFIESVEVYAAYSSPSPIGRLTSLSVYEDKRLIAIVQGDSGEFLGSYVEPCLVTPGGSLTIESGRLMCAFLSERPVCVGACALRQLLTPAATDWIGKKYDPV